MSHYQRSYYSAPKRKRWRVVPASIIAIAILFIVFAIGIGRFQGRAGDRSNYSESVLEQNSESLSDSFFGRQISQMRWSADDALTNKLGATSEYRKATVEREFSNNQYTVIILTSLPEPPEGYYYEVWLLQREPEFDFFSLGKMFHNDAGQLYKQWDGKQGESYAGYTEAVVTLEADDGNLDPSAHVLEGGF
ncbi:MAG: hypothetical protein ACD_76C00088G0011 [uncultured bacterium]|nr:MAG: hypothetical protein ACD_76C00088G0011 [uncultured bacterium]HBD05335.1 hypothetical protein [Candidatus Uhrbacteria bacterium]